MRHTITALNTLMVAVSAYQAGQGIHPTLNIIGAAAWGSATLFLLAADRGGKR